MANPPWNKGTLQQPSIANTRKRTTGGQQGYSLPALSDSSEKGRRSSPAHEGGRLRHLEGRVNLGEQSNKALLEELVRLQGDLKGSIRRNQDILREEREERLILAEKIQAANNLYTQMMMRMARAEEKIETEHNTVGSLVNHTKQVEQALIGNQQQLLSRREQITVHVERLRDDIEDMRENCEQLQKNMRALTDDVRTMKSKHEVQVVQFGTVVQEIRQRVKKIEGDTSAALSSLHKQRDEQDSKEASTFQFKNTVEARLADMKEITVELRRRIEAEENERRTSNQQNQLNLEQLKAVVQENNLKREEEVYASAMSSKEKESLLENERNMISTKLAEINEDQNKKMLQKEIRLREDAQAKFVLLEKKLREEQASRLLFERSVREEMEKRWQSLKAYIDEEAHSIRQSEKMTQARFDQSLVRLNESIALLERQMEEGRKGIEQVLHAEITSRQSQNDKLSNRCNQLQEKLNMAIGTLQQALGGVNSQVSENVEKAKEELKSLMDKSNVSGVKGIADMDKRLNKLSKRITEVEGNIKKLEKLGKSEDDERDMSAGLVAGWRRDTEEQFREVNEKLRPLPDQLLELQRQLAALKMDLEAKEAADRTKAAETRPPSPPVAKKTEPEPEPEPEPKPEPEPEPEHADEETDTEDMRNKVNKLEEEIQYTSSQVAKLENTVETLRTVLTQKIQSEAQTRGDSVAELKEQLDKIKSTE
ncbi:coiled-coil domain-containing protein 154-like isoform X5 [Acropora millepora]|uniref:coiled-coil domain-containing protein 154-like isoform X5 n=1 Tax=Acropora millepora TaxID=45264 RepID=UPI001CF419D2|nr:coiled-coil domain-containing protein 154-like isoform X5 [Acropora millepora]